MSSNFGDDSTVEPATSRGRDWPCLTQFNIFLENRVGALHQVLRRLERQDLRIVALSILDSADCAMVRLIVDQYERAREVMTFANMTLLESYVIGVRLPDSDQPHAAILSALMSAELNVQYMYPINFRKNGRGAVALFLTDIDEGLRVLKERNFELVTEDDLMMHDEFF
jgi:hypothetical protein